MVPDPPVIAVCEPRDDVEIGGSPAATDWLSVQVQLAACGRGVAAEAARTRLPSSRAGLPELAARGDCSARTGRKHCEAASTDRA